MTIIDLGEVTTSSAPGGGPRPLRLRDVRWAALIVLAVVATLLLGGSAVPVRRSLVELWRMPIDSPGSFTLTADRVYVHHVGATPGIDAYSAVDGTLLWRFSAPEMPSWIGTDIAGLVLVPVAVQQPDGSTVVQDTIALDAATGAERWRQRGDLLSAEGGILLLAEYRREAEVAAVSRIRPSDGARLWRYVPTVPVASIDVGALTPGEPTSLITVTATGRVEIRDLAGLAEQRSGRVPWLVAHQQDNTYAYLETFGSQFFVVRVEQGRTDVNGFDIATLRGTWRWSGPGGSSVFPCGDLICIGSGEGGVRALDPGTGGVRWTSSGWDYGNAIGGGMLYVESHRGAGQGVVDPATGTMVAHFPPGTAVSDREGRQIVQLVLTAETPPRNAVYELRDDRTLLLRGALPRAGDPGCQLARGRLACVNFLDPVHQEITVTAVGLTPAG